MEANSTTGVAFLVCLALLSLLGAILGVYSFARIMAWVIRDGIMNHGMGSKLLVDLIAKGARKGLNQHNYQEQV